MNPHQRQKIYLSEITSIYQVEMLVELQQKVLDNVFGKVVILLLS